MSVRGRVAICFNSREIYATSPARLGICYYSIVQYYKNELPSIQEFSQNKPMSLTEPRWKQSVNSVSHTYHYHLNSSIIVSGAPVHRGPSRDQEHLTVVFNQQDEMIPIRIQQRENEHDNSAKQHHVLHCHRQYYTSNS